MTYLEPNGHREGAAAADASQMLAGLRFGPWPLESTWFEALLISIRESHVNGGALFARFHVHGNSAQHWLGARNSADRLLFFERFLTGPEVRAALPDLQVEQSRGLSSAFELVSAFTLVGDLANTLITGGAYIQSSVTRRAAKALARRGCHDLLDEHRDELVLYRSLESWSPWFQGVAWDQTWLGIDTRDLAVWLLCITDTD